MKKLLSFCFFIIFSQIISAQNLVPNYSFEVYDTCPNSFTQVRYAVGWNTYGIDAADYFNACAPDIPGNSFSVPSNTAGYQNAFEGVAYCGLITYSHPPAESNYREYLSAQLITPLAIGNKYYVSMKISCADKDYQLFGATNNIGILFTTYPYHHYYPDTIVNNFSHINTVSIITDTINWTTVSGSFIADSVYQFINIGNFYSDSLTNYYNPSGNPNKQAYYYVDMVCVSLDSLTCFEPDNVLENILEDGIDVSPNPTSNFFNVKFNTPFVESISLEIFSIYGILQKRIDKIKEFQNIDVSCFSNGIYILKIHIKNKSFYKKIIINH